MRPHKSLALIGALTVLFAAACQTQPQAFKLVPKQTLLFADAPDVTYNRFGFVKNRNDDHGFYYFADTRTQNAVYLYGENGKLLDPVRLPKLMPKDDHVNYVIVKSRDTLITTSGHDNYMYVFGKGGKTYSVADFEPLLYQGRNYTLAGPGRADFARDVAYSYIWLDATQMRYPDTMTGEQQLRHYYGLAHSGPLLAKITGLTGGHPKVDLLFAGLQNRMGLDTFMGGTTRLFAASEQSVYVHYPEADTLYKLDPETGNVKNAIRLRADHARITLDKVPFGADNQAAYDASVTEKGIIRYMDYDPYRKLLYLRYFYEAASTAKPSEKGDHRPWAMMVYDDRLNKIGEAMFAADTYNPMTLLITPQGLLFEKINLNQHDVSQKEFQLFEVGHGRVRP